MTYKEETFTLKALKELKDAIRSPVIKQLIKETHENNIMLRQLIAYFNKEILYANQENENDFGRNVLANLISSGFDIKKLIRR